MDCLTLTRSRGASPSAIQDAPHPIRFELNLAHQPRRALRAVGCLRVLGAGLNLIVSPSHSSWHPLREGRLACRGLQATGRIPSKPQQPQSGTACHD